MTPMPKEPAPKHPASKPRTEAVDVTEIGQPASSGGARGCATAYGGVERVAPRTKPAGADRGKNGSRENQP